VFNHGLTIRQVVRGAQEFFPVIAVNDGSTDQTGPLLEAEKEITLVTLPHNQGKAAALKAGFARAQELGFSHAITLDADGQHPVAALPEFAAASRRRPEAFVIGVRDFKLAGAPWPRRFSNGLSNFWFRFETGVHLADTQCGYRVYPLAAITPLQVKADRYAYELEIMVKAAWAGVPLEPLPVQADYAAPTSRLSHFRPLRDFVRAGRVHSRLASQALCIPAPIRKLAAQGLWPPGFSGLFAGFLL
jgi:glycosyltransferase involved in cell wall biosynthesis